MFLPWFGNKCLISSIVEPLVVVVVLVSVEGGGDVETMVSV